ncbi:MAG: cob(I)yrinic acid a,c-diamide adenosyltransferase [Alcanivoracaceae bacterium]|nr:cob(I)yrinic acid a,c-diamide adenosyltransferase [Alcanivoracaceae bacterium]
MGNRLSKIVTKTGDDGSTGLASGKRVSKAADIIDAIGSIDELNSSIGLVRSICDKSQLDNELTQLQHNLFNCGGDLCLLGSVLISQKDIDELECSIQQYNEKLTPLKNFILPAGSELTSRLHMARSICRRAERVLVKTQNSHEFNPLLIIFVNRLSDWLFVIARVTDETEEVMWC